MNMSRKNIPFIEGQGSLFGLDGSPTPELGEVHNLTEASYPVSYGPEGSYVNVAERAQLLESSLTALGRRNQRLGFDVAKRDFWGATGFAALRGLGLMNDAEIDARGRKMWRDFTHAYGDPQVRPQRDKYKKQLKKAKIVRFTLPGGCFFG